MNFDVLYSMILGILIGSIIFYLFCRPVSYHGPNSNDVRKKIYNYNGKQYTLTPVMYECPKYM